MSDGDFTDLMRNASLVLGLINVLQPITRKDLDAKFGTGREAELNQGIGFLKEQRLIRELPSSRYRTTWKGQQALWSRLLTRRRDVQRLWYLSDLSDQRRRGGEEGETS